MSYYDPYSDLDRLKVQSEIHRRIDEDAIATALEIRGAQSKPIRVLDVGCGDGTVTQSRFASQDFLVTAVDLSKDAIESAKASNKSDNITFVHGDILTLQVDQSFDIIWCAQFLQHVQNPKTTIEKIWGLLAPKGVVVFRNSDDGMDTTYPPIEGFENLIKASQSFANSSDRFVGRKLYHYLKTSMNPEASSVQVRFEPVSNHDKSKEERAALFEVRHGFRLPALRRVLDREAEIVVGERVLNLKALENIAERARDIFVNDETTISFSVQFIAFAQRPEERRDDV